MADSFAARARQIGGQVSLILGWTPDQFWTATPDELLGIFAAMEEAGSPGAPVRPLDRRTLEQLQKDDPDG
ncbi:Phage tail assembly chaperone protein, TAC [Parasphingorhabdus marina DSM 22363]|uniref:Phage tail assembly chaperone protein, TAC n=1 Tax=Parasphingorhabdus marina DSM 22363 TaxID=1123272 RepID=A0A1N6CMM6_9SPHN|nr:phage tail assembly chaperone [Parasphingorhabdus marina]SIN59624.1 Phage tail assembly chaperone protein, TAC [Parasphingorhabdus marina DSM 22363]